MTSLKCFDMTTETTTEVASLAGLYGTTVASHFAYDQATGTLYALDGLQNGKGLLSIDLATGEVEDVCRFTLDTWPESAVVFGDMYKDAFVGLACNYDGDMYGVTYFGSLYRIDQLSGDCTFIGELDLYQGFSYYNNHYSLFFDNENDELFFRNYTFNAGYEVLRIDTGTAHAEVFAKLAAGSILDGICIPYEAADAQAPAKVGSLTVVPGAEGALEARLSWTNPTLTFGGQTLTDLDSVVVLRNDVLVACIATSTPGAAQSWTDTPTERGFYTYTVMAVNGHGRGDRQMAKVFVGPGNPMPVTGVTLMNEDDMARISWQAPTKGENDTWIDVTALTYDVVRYPGEVTVATGITATTWLDETITELQKVYYTVTARTADGQSQPTASPSVVIGPPFDVPHTFEFLSQDEFDIWTVLDNNTNNYAWTWNSALYGGLRGAQNSYHYDNLVANDWLISPRLNLKGGQHYKVEFDARPASSSVPEILAVAIGRSAENVHLDSIAQFDILGNDVHHLRVNLPVSADDWSYYVAFLHRSNVVNYNLTVGNVSITEDHEGYIAGRVTDANGNVLEGVTVSTADGLFTATTDAEGNYRLDYLPAASYDLKATLLGYEDLDVAGVAVTELTTTTRDLQLAARPVFTLQGTVKDVAGDPVAGAAVVVTGYNDYDALTDADGHFAISLFRSNDYQLAVTKNKLVGVERLLSVSADTDLGDIVLEDNVKPVRSVSVEEDTDVAVVSWEAPVNDAEVRRVDDGTFTATVGSDSWLMTPVYGVVRREPATVHGAQFYIASTPTASHTSVTVYVIDLDADGETTDELLYQGVAYVTDNQWNTFTLPQPVEAPRGYMLALSAYNYLGLGLDGDGDKERYPFAERINCFTNDGSEYTYLDDMEDDVYHRNFLIRPVDALYTVAEDADAARHMAFGHRTKPQPLALNEVEPMVVDCLQTAGPLKTVQRRVRYDVYRLPASAADNSAEWTLLAEGVDGRTYSDTDWTSLPQGTLRYAVKAVYTGGLVSEPTVSDSIGCKMHTVLTVSLTTNTPDSESAGALVSLSDGTHSYQATADAEGRATLSNVWKAAYQLTVTLDGFDELTTTLDLSADDAYDYSAELQETQVEPFNLIIAETDEGEADSRLFLWNYPDLISDSFEEHDDFAINSPGPLGWQYIDADGDDTGALTSTTWPGAFDPMAYIVFNPYTTVPPLTDIYGVQFEAHSGQKVLADFAAVNVANDDWLISPRLFFQQDYQLSFFAKSASYYNTERFDVAYSTTGTDIDDFQFVAQNVYAYSSWAEYKYDIPADARYVAIRCTSDGQRIFMLDDVSMGLPQAAPARMSRVRRAPLADGAFEVYLDGELVARTSDTRLTLEHLTDGWHTAGVVAAYTSGRTQMSTVSFLIGDDATGISAMDNGQLTIDHYFDLQGRRVSSQRSGAKSRGVYISQDRRKVVVK